MSFVTRRALSTLIPPKVSSLQVLPRPTSIADTVPQVASPKVCTEIISIIARDRACDVLGESDSSVTEVEPIDG